MTTARNTPEISRTLVLSTAHVPGHLAKSVALDLQQDDFYVPVDQYTQGWTCHVCMETIFEFVESTPREHWFKPVLMVALENKCDRVQFDCDAYVLEGLETYEW